MAIITMLFFACLSVSCAKDEPVNIRVEKPVVDVPDDNPDIPDEPEAVFPRLILQSENYELYKSRFLAMPEGSQSRKNAIVKAYFSDSETDKKAATAEFMTYWKNYSKRWTEEALQGGDNGVVLRGVWRSIHLYDIVKSFGFLTPDEDREFRLALRKAVKGAVGNDSKNPIIPDKTRDQNIYTDVFLAAGLVGLVFPSLPESADWVSYALSELEWQLKNCIWDTSCWHESPRYHIYTLTCAGQFMEIYKNITGTDLFQREEFKNLSSWCVRFNSPNDRLAGKKAGVEQGVRLLPGIGDTAWGEDISILNLYASHYAATEPELSGQIMWIWEQSGKGFTGEPVLDLLIDYTLPSLAPESVGSEINEKKGYISMRAGFNTEDEVWMLLKSGDYSWHEHPDKGSFSLIAYGTPFALDSGSADYNDPIHRSWHKKAFSHNLVTFKETGVTDLMSCVSPGGEHNGDVVYWESGDAVDYAVTDASAIFGLINRREVIFVKPDYFVVRDVVDGGNLESVWLMSSPCDEFIWNEHDVLCVNNEFGTSMQIHVVSPDARLVQNETPNRHFGTWTGTSDKNVAMYPVKYQTTVQIAGPVKGEIVTVLHPMKEEMESLTVGYAEGVVSVRCGDRDDRIAFTQDGALVNKGSETVELIIK